MKVKDLIEQLSKYPEDMNVRHRHWDDTTSSVEGVGEGDEYDWALGETVKTVLLSDY